MLFWNVTDITKANANIKLKKKLSFRFSLFESVVEL